jgi:hypothetical protein
MRPGLVTGGRVDVRPFVSHRFALNEANEARWHFNAQRRGVGGPPRSSPKALASVREQGFERSATKAGSQPRYPLVAANLEQAFGARPTGLERADAIKIRIPIERANHGCPRGVDSREA